MALRTEWIDEVGNEIFLTGAGFECFFFILDDDFVVGHFNYFLTRNSKLGIDEAFDEWTFDDDLLNEEIISVDGKIDELAEFGTFLGLYGQGGEIEIKFKNLFKTYDVLWANELVNAINNHTIIGIFTDRINIEIIDVSIDERAGETKSDNFEIVGVNDGAIDCAYRATRLDTEDTGF